MKKTLIFSLAIFLILLFNSFTWAEVKKSTWTGPVYLDNSKRDYNWGNERNWLDENGMVGVPNNNETCQYIAIIPDPEDIDEMPDDTIVIVNGHFTINSLDLNGRLKITTGNLYDMHWLAMDADGATSSINGIIYISDTSNYIESWNNANLYIRNNHTFTGNGNIFFSTSNQNKILGKGHLTIGKDLTIKTEGEGSWGEIGVNLTNNGLITADNGYIFLSNSDMINSGLIKGVNGGTLKIKNSLTNTENGQIIADETSKLIFKYATVNNSGTIKTLASDETSKLYSSTIKGGNVVFKGNLRVGEESHLISDGGNFVLGGETTIAPRAHLYLNGTIINNGEIVLRGSISNTLFYSELDIQDDVTIDGEGSIKFGTKGGNSIRSDGDNSHLTIGSNQLITADLGTGGSISVPTTLYGTMQANGGTLSLPNKLTNNGLIRSANGSTLDIKNSIDGTGAWEADGGTLNIKADVSTTGKIEIRNNGQLNVNSVSMSGSDLIMDNTAGINVNSELALSGDLSFAMTDESKWRWGDKSVLKMNGQSNQALEVGGKDLGESDSGFSNNFDLHHLIIEGDGTYVSLVDLIDNNNGDNEALYVDDLDVYSGATLNLNGIHLYTMYNNSPHLVVAGDGELFGGGTIVDKVAPVPLPSALYLLGASLLGLLALKKKSSIVLNQEK